MKRLSFMEKYKISNRTERNNMRLGLLVKMWIRMYLFYCTVVPIFTLLFFIATQKLNPDLVHVILKAAKLKTLMSINTIVQLYGTILVLIWLFSMVLIVWAAILSLSLYLFSDTFSFEIPFETDDESNPHIYLFNKVRKTKMFSVRSFTRAALTGLAVTQCGYLIATNNYHIMPAYNTYTFLYVFVPFALALSYVIATWCKRKHQIQDANEKN